MSRPGFDRARAERDRTARVIVVAQAFIQNLCWGFYDLGSDVRLADAFAELALVV